MEEQETVEKPGQFKQSQGRRKQQFAGKLTLKKEKNM